MLVTAWLRPATCLSCSSSWERAWVRAFISFNRSSPRPYCKISESPRRLSSTKLESSPDCSRNRRPLSPLALEVTSGTATPTTA